MPRDAPATDDESDEPVQLTRGAASLAALALLTGALSACGDDEPTESTTTASPIGHGSDTETSSSSTSSSSTSGSSSSATTGDVAELPEAATKRTKEGAIAFNEFFQVLSGEGLRKGDATVLDEYAKGCAACDAFVKQIEENSKRGVTMNKNPYSVSDASARKRDDGGYRVEMTVNVEKYNEVLSDGSKGRTAKPLDMTVVSDTQWEDGHWVIRDLVRVQ